MGALFSDDSGDWLTSWEVYISDSHMQRFAIAKLGISVGFGLRAVMLLVACMAGLTVAGRGQSGTSSAISGKVSDTSGALVPNAAVTATETNTKAVLPINGCKRTLPFFLGESPHISGDGARSRFRCGIFGANTSRGWTERGIELFAPSSVVESDSRDHRAAGTLEPR
jgi:hypothetical protein